MYPQQVKQASILQTDAYKFSMAQAGFPLRRETFYFSCRSGGFLFVPLDLEQAVQSLVDGLLASGAEGDADLGFLEEHGYGLTPAMATALEGELRIQAVPANTWVFEREPILTVTGPSFLVSYLEPMLLWLNYPLQLATHARLQLRGSHKPDLSPYGLASCEEHRQIIQAVLSPILGREIPVRVEADAYRERVRQQVRQLVAAVGDPRRIFEVGMRSAVCMQQHRLALEACKEEGVLATSNVFLAKELEMLPVGTMGHEHVQRWGNDLDAFRSMRDMRTSPPSYLLDTFDTIASGLPAAKQVMLEQSHACSVRYDSGNKVTQYLFACELFEEAGLSPVHVIEDGLDLEMTRKFEELRKFTGLPEEQQIYGYGGCIVANPAGNIFSRDSVSAVYKLSESSGEPRMKFSDEQGLGKMSWPGRPVIWRRRRGEGPIGTIGQEGEEVASDCVCLNGNKEAKDPLQPESLELLVEAHQESPYNLSPETQGLVDRLRAKRQNGAETGGARCPS